MTPKKHADLRLIAMKALGRNELEANVRFCEENGLTASEDLEEFKRNGGELPGATSYTFTKKELEALLALEREKPRGRPISIETRSYQKWAKLLYPDRLKAMRESGEPDPKNATLEEMSEEFGVSVDTLSSWIWPRRGRK